MRIKIDKPDFGDLVEVFLVKRKYKGIFLENLGEKDIILLKLDSGYNIGFRKKEILGVKIIERFKEREGEREDLDLKSSREKPKIGMIITGGTIAARLNPKKGGVDWLTKPEDLFRIYPKVFDIANVELDVPFMKASEDMDFKDWQKIARSAKKFLDRQDIKGVIITHGTDFLHYTSAALSFFLRDLKKPVVFTYSQRSIDRASSDATLNLECSALAAISDIAEVMLVGHGTINDDYCFAMPGTKTRKMHTSRRDAFKVINGKPFAKIYPNKVIKISDYNLRVQGKGKVKTDLKFEEKVALVKVYPGQDPEILDYYLKKKYRGLILEMSGLGHVPSRKARKSWINKLKEIQKKGIVICATPQTIYGRLDSWVYSNGRELAKIGIIYLEDMLSETALVKLGWVLGHPEWAKSKDKVKEKMLENIAGEFSDRLEK